MGDLGGCSMGHEKSLFVMDFIFHFLFLLHPSPSVSSQNGKDWKATKSTAGDMHYHLGHPPPPPPLIPGEVAQKLIEIMMLEDVALSDIIKA